MPPPIVIFSIQFTLSLVLYALVAIWYVAPRLSTLPRSVALQPLLLVHAFRIVGGSILAPGSVGPGVPTDFQTMVGIGDLVTAFVAIVALIAIRYGVPGALAFVWLLLIVGTADTVNAIIQSTRYDVFTHALGFNWVIVTSYVPALLVSSVLVLLLLLRPATPPGDAAPARMASSK
jgi:hypothetical protein